MCPRLVLDAHLDENRVRGRERLAQRAIELGATADPHGFDTLSACQGAEIEVRQQRARRRREAEVRCEFIERAIAAVVDDHEGDGQCELRRTPQSLDGIHGRPVAMYSIQGLWSAAELALPVAF